MASGARLTAAATCTTMLFAAPAVSAQEVSYPQVVKVRYQALDPNAGGHFLLWVEREKIFYGLDPRLYPAARSVDVTHITPAAGSNPITVIAVTSIKSAVPDYFHLSGNVRFKITGMTIVTTNVPAEPK